MDSLTQLFCQLVSIPSPSGKELAVGTFIKTQLAASGIDADFDASGELNDSESGNLVARLQGTPGLPTLLFVAHMDTVESGEKPVSPHVENDVIKSDGTSILGADNKGSVAALIEALKETSNTKKRPTIIATFTSREEKGKMGSSVLTLSDDINLAFNLDGEEPIGRVIYQTLGEVPFSLVVRGKAAHAASSPERGINALTTAAEIITKLPIGKNGDNVVLNIGTIQGGSGNNIVPALVEIEGQVRAFSQEEIDTEFKRMTEMIDVACRKSGCIFELIQKPEEGAPPAAVPKDHPIIGVAQRAIESLGLEFSLERGSFSADANFLSKRYPTVTIKRGSRDPHSLNESMSVTALQNLKKIILAIIQETADGKVELK